MAQKLTFNNFLLPLFLRQLLYRHKNHCAPKPPKGDKADVKVKVEPQSRAWGGLEGPSPQRTAASAVLGSDVHKAFERPGSLRGGSPKSGGRGAWESWDLEDSHLERAAGAAGEELVKFELARSFHFPKIQEVLSPLFDMCWFSWPFGCFLRLFV